MGKISEDVFIITVLQFIFTVNDFVSSRYNFRY
jgi:hypothetical protein